MDLELDPPTQLHKSKPKPGQPAMEGPALEKTLRETSWDEFKSLPGIEYFTKPLDYKDTPIITTLLVLDILKDALKENETRQRLVECGAIQDRKALDKNLCNRAIDKVEKLLLDTKNRPALKDLRKLQQTAYDIGELLHEAGKHPYDWMEEREDGTLDRNVLEMREAQAKIRYIETSPEYAAMEAAAELEMAELNALEAEAMETLDPETVHILTLPRRLQELDELFHACNKDREWRQEVEDNGNYKKWSDEHEALYREAHLDRKFPFKQEDALEKLRIAVATLKQSRKTA